MRLPDPHLTILCGLPGAGKSTWARQAGYAETEIVSSDACALMVADGACGHDWQTRTLVRTLVELRCQAGRRTVVDALNLEPFRRRELAEIARAYRLPVSLIVLDVDLATAQQRARQRLAEGRHPYPTLPEKLPALHALVQQTIEDAPFEGYDGLTLLYHDEPWPMAGWNTPETAAC